MLKEINRSFSKRIALNIIGVVSALLVLTLISVAFYSHSIIVSEAMKSAEKALGKAVTGVEKTLSNVETAADDAALFAEYCLDDKDALFLITEHMVKNHPEITGSAVAFIPSYFKGEHYFSPYSWRDKESGLVFRKQLGTELYDYFSMDWYNVPMLSGKPFWSEPYFDEGGGEILMSTYSVPVRDKNGEIVAILTADISLDWLSDQMKEIKPYPSAVAFILSQAGAFIGASENISVRGKNVDEVIGDTKDKTADKILASMKSGKDTTIVFTIGNTPSFAVMGPMDNGWSASIICNYKEILSSSHKMRILLIVIGLVVLLLIYLYSRSAIHKLTKPIEEMSESAKAIAEGDFDVTLPIVKSEDEIRELRDSFDMMKTSIKQYIDDLKSTRSAKERIESELNIAQGIQLGMLPRTFPDHSNVNLYARMIPAREVGGDYYDFEIRGKYLYFSVGDVSGKGVPAALFMAITMCIFRFVTGMNMSLEEIVKKMNDSLSENNESGLFVTLFAGKLDLDTGYLEYCNAGHNPIVIAEPGESPRYLTVKPNVAMGVLPDFKYELEKASLKPGTKLLLYTDGVTEAEREDHEQFSEARLIDFLSALPDKMEAEDAVERILDGVREFTCGAAQNDDITMMAIEYKGSGV